MHSTNKRRVNRQNIIRTTMVANLMTGTALPSIAPMERTVAERVASAIITKDFDLWAWMQGRVQFLNPAQIDIAIKIGLGSLVEQVINGSDSADPFYTIRGGWSTLARHYPHALAIHTRCAGGKDGHSGWAYGPVYVSQHAAKDAGHLWQCECNCGWTANPLD